MAKTKLSLAGDFLRITSVEIYQGRQMVGQLQDTTVDVFRLSDWADVTYLANLEYDKPVKAHSSFLPVLLDFRLNTSSNVKGSLVAQTAVAFKALAHL